MKAKGVRNTSVMRKGELQKLMAEMGLLEEQSDVLEKDKEQPTASVEKGPEHEVKARIKSLMFFVAEHPGRNTLSEQDEQSGQNARNGQDAQKERSVRSGQNAQKEQSARSGQNAQKGQNARNDRHIQMADCTVAEETPTVSAARTTSGMRTVSAARTTSAMRTVSVTKTASEVRIISVMTVISVGTVANGWMFTRKMSISSQMRKVKSQVMVS